ncbi:hypothetical protein CFC21_001677 [Triticum aestivum]|uniref:Flotillin-like n=1 Tax=Triticum aestivum TaxID=4565 RepID=A0A3B5XY64_WHEAT|nr:hypothetical protein CFC21_001677 [Triticum aestivum]
MATFRVADASEYLAITGWGIDDVKLAKKAAEKLPFILPAVFTIGPKITATGAEASDKRDLEAQLLLYAKLIAPLHRSRSHVHELVKGIIEGETRVLAADLTMEEIFKGTKTFKEKVFNRVQLELNQFELVIYNANVKQLVDVPGHEYLSYLGQKTQQDAANQAKQGQGLKEEAKVKAEVQVFENAREADIAAAKAELAMKKAGFDKQAKVAEVKAAKAVAVREAELQMEVERKNAMRQTKAEQLSKATVQYETQVQESNALFYSRQKAAEAALFEQMRTAEARKAQADAQFFEQKMAEDAKLYAKQKEAESLALLGRAKTEYAASMLQALGGNYYALRDYLMIDGGMYTEMASINAGAVNGMQPKISIWSNGAGADGATNAGKEAAGGSALQQVAGVYKMLPPLLSTVHEQTGMLPPAWMRAAQGQRRQLIVVECAFLV